MAVESDFRRLIVMRERTESDVLPVDLRWIFLLGICLIPGVIATRSASGASCYVSTAGSAAIIYGSGFSKTIKQDTIFFGSKKAHINKATTTGLKVTIPARLEGVVAVKVVVNNTESNLYNFTVK